MSKRESPHPPGNPRTRASVYGLAALYLVYLYYKIAQPFLTHDPYGPTTLQFALGSVILGGGALFLAALAWRMYKAPVPEVEPEDPALPEESEEDAPGEDLEEDDFEEED